MPCFKINFLPTDLTPRVIELKDSETTLCRRQGHRCILCCPLHTATVLFAVDTVRQFRTEFAYKFHCFSAK